MKIRLLAAALLLLAVSAVAQQRPAIQYTPVNCVLADEQPVLQLDVAVKGELRAYFRRANTTDWCSVIGNNMGPLSNVVLPKFAPAEEIEYFFLVLDGKRVVARSNEIYRVKITERCSTPVARHNYMVFMDCDDGGVGSLPASMGAGYSLSSTGDPTEPSPSSPTQAATSSTARRQ